MGQVVDTETAKEFMTETLERVGVEELARICVDVEAKSEWFRERLAPDALASLSADEFGKLLRQIFSTRGKARKALEAMDWPQLRASIETLLYGPAETTERFQAFIETLDPMAENLRADFASELLHFSDPDKHWLWTRWMWDPRTRTGSLPLVTTAAYDLSGERTCDVYVAVGRAIAFVHQVGDAAGFRKISSTIFGTDVFLSCVYIIYTYTVLRMRMTKEFNKVMPGLPEFSRRLLGVYRKAAAPSGRH